MNEGYASLHRRKQVEVEKSGFEKKDAEIKDDLDWQWKKDKKPIHLPTSIHAFYGIIIIFMLSFSVVFYSEMWLPTPKGLDIPRNEFSEARTREDLTDLLSFGMRVVGTKANEVDSPQFILQKIEKIQQQASPEVNIEVQVQQPSGAFGLNFLSQFQNVYSNVTNILVLLSPKKQDNESNRESLLISSHYDASPGAPGASDDGVNVAIMLELLGIFSVSPPKSSSIIFNFNGAEETILQASHGFITQHPWRDSIRAFINLEAAGAGGRELLFQTGSDVLTKAYAANAKYPRANSFGQEVFQSGIIPSDTDYRVYRDYGHIAGMDFAYIENGYVYHTRLDDIDQIQPGSIQRFGDNLIGTIRQLVDEKGLLSTINGEEDAKSVVYFDILGFYMISYPHYVAMTINSCIALASGIYLLSTEDSLSQKLRALCVAVISLLSGIGSSLLVSIIMSLLSPLSWYASSSFGVILYGCPALLGFVTILGRFVSEQLSSDMDNQNMIIRTEQRLFESSITVWWIIFTVLTSYRCASAYAFGLWVAIGLLGHLVCNSFRKSHYFTPARFIAIYCFSLAIPLINTGQLLVLGIQFFVPIMGRSGTTLPPDVVISLYISLGSVLLFLQFGSLLAFVSSKSLRKLQTGLLFVIFLSMFYGSFGNCYTESSPKRLFLFHIERTSSISNQTDSGLWMIPIDFNGMAPLKSTLKQAFQLTKDATPPQESDSIYSNFPWYFPLKNVLPLETTWYIPLQKPHVESSLRPSLEVVSSIYDDEKNRRKIHFVLVGPSHMTLYIDAKKTTLTSWSLGNGTDNVPPDEKDCYFIYFANGQPPTQLHFWVEVAGNQSLEMAYAGFYFDMNTPELKASRNIIPKWVDTIEFVSLWHSEIY